MTVRDDSDFTEEKRSLTKSRLTDYIKQKFDEMPSLGPDPRHFNSVIEKPLVFPDLKGISPLSSKQHLIGHILSHHSHNQHS